MDLSHWDLVNDFTMREAACLAGGIEPLLYRELSTDKTAKAQIIHRVIETDYKAAISVAHFALEKKRRDQYENAESVFSALPEIVALPSFHLLRVVELCLYTGREFDVEPFSSYDENSPITFARERLGDWFSLKGVQPIYSFVPLPEERSITGLTAPNNSPEAIGRREQQHEVILAVIAALNYDPLNIPDGGKAKIKAACLTRPRLFTSDSFDHAWKASAGLFRMANHEKYSPK